MLGHDAAHSIRMLGRAERRGLRRRVAGLRAFSQRLVRARGQLIARSGLVITGRLGASPSRARAAAGRAASERELSGPTPRRHADGLGPRRRHDSRFGSVASRLSGAGSGSASLRSLRVGWLSSERSAAVCSSVDDRPDLRCAHRCRDPRHHLRPGPFATGLLSSARRGAFRSAPRLSRLEWRAHARLISSR